MYEFFVLGFVALIVLVLGIFIVFPLSAKFGIRAMNLGIVVCAVGILYAFFGGAQNFFEHRTTLSQKKQVNALLQSNPGRKQIIAAIKNKISQQPNSDKGWYLLGRLYAGEGDWQAAKTAFEMAIQYDKHNESYHVNLAQSMWQLNQQQWNDEIRQKFKMILQKNPKQPDALAMLALDRYQSKEYGVAVRYWQRLLLLMPEGHKDAQAIEKAIAAAKRKIQS